MRFSWCFLYLILAGLNSFAPLALGSGDAASLSYEEEDPAYLQIQSLPLQYISVKGDESKFRSQHWTKTGYVGGLEKFSQRYESPEHIMVSMEGQAKSGNNDYSGLLDVKKEEVGYLHLNYSQYPKYYDSSGGVFARFQSLSSNKLDRDLKLDLGHFSLETGLTLPRLPAVSFLYDHTYKDGDKSRLTWTTVTDRTVLGPIGQRKIGPAWQSLKEETDSFAVKSSYEIAGFILRGEQGWKTVKTDSRRFEKNLSFRNTEEQERALLIYDQNPETHIWSSRAEVERWFWEKKAVVATGYKLNRVMNREDATIRQYNEAGAPRSWGNWSTPFTRPRSNADSKLNSNILNSRLMVAPWAWLNLGTKIRAESTRRGGFSMYEQDRTNPPDTVIDQTYYSGTQDQDKRMVESFSVQFKKIPRTALYAEMELEQAKNNSEQGRYCLDGQTNNWGWDTFSADTASRSRERQLKVGGTVSPWSFFDVKSGFRSRHSTDVYDEIRSQAENLPATSAFLNLMDQSTVETKEADIQGIWKPYAWFQSSVKYKISDSLSDHRVPGQDVVKTSHSSREYSFNQRLLLGSQLSVAVSLFKQNSVTRTPAILSGEKSLPHFNADRSTWLFSVQYHLTKRLVLDSGVSYSWANNYNDFSELSLPLGADFKRTDFLTGLKWILNSNVSFALKYGLSIYNAKPSFDVGHYIAHMISANGMAKWG